jgi:hypothetical protein
MKFKGMITKAKLKETLEQFPDEFTLDELMERVILIDKINKGDEQSKRGETLSEDELDKEMSKWFK